VLRLKKVAENLKQTLRKDEMIIKTGNNCFFKAAILSIFPKNEIFNPA
jgi:hypothetical protein